MGGPITSVSLAPLWHACGHISLFYLLTVLKNPYKGISPMDIGMAKR
jgi:hypothetical protein